MPNKANFENNIPSTAFKKGVEFCREQAVGPIGLVSITDQLVGPVRSGQNKETNVTRQGRTIESMNDRRDCSLQNKPIEGRIRPGNKE